MAGTHRMVVARGEGKAQGAVQAGSEADTQRVLRLDWPEAGARPFRTFPLTRRTPWEELDRLNRAENRHGAGAFLPARDAIRSIREVKRPSPNRVQGWIEHPDEAVPVALAWSHLRRGLWSTRWDSAFGPALLERARAEAEAEKLLWTPLLDLSSCIVDPEATGPGAPPLELLFYVEELEGEELEETLESLSRFRSRPLVQEVARRLEGPSDEMVGRLMSRKGGALGLAANPTLSGAQREAVAAWAVSDLSPLGEAGGKATSGRETWGREAPEKVWVRILRPVQVLEALRGSGWGASDGFFASLKVLAGSDPEATGHKAVPKARLRRRLSAALCLHVLGDAEALPVVEKALMKGPALMDPGTIRWLGAKGLLTIRTRRWIFQNSKSQWEIEAVLDLAEKLDEREAFILVSRGTTESVFGGEAAFHLVRLLQKYLQEHPRCVETARRAARRVLQGECAAGVRRSEFALKRAMEFLVDLASDERHLLELRPPGPAPQLIARRLLSHPCAGPALWKEALGWDQDSSWLIELAKVPRARRHPEVRRALLKKKEPEVLRALLQDGRSAEFRKLVPRLLATHPRIVVEVFRGFPREVLEGMDRSVLGPLLASDHDEVRRVAFEAVAKVGLGAG